MISRHNWHLPKEVARFCPQSLVLWSFIVIFYSRNNSLHLVKNWDREIPPLCETLYFIYSCSTALHSGKKTEFIILIEIYILRYLCCDVRYDFRIKRSSIRLYLQLFVGWLISYLRYLGLFDSSLPPVVCRRVHILFTLFVFVYV